ncbi:FimV/HubP family polar landmark protein [Metapseudomonas otitidis]|uniref:FimV/HubP family polar landmark protein n=1 Tax=Metapseudomonas otitidis TaxID=319939 RepID=UPI001F113525|nr:FimV/HubP family polar landmark protein [Pseudomonas otitidis]
MARFNTFLAALASGPLLYSGLASALGMGDITLHSALNQPLEADIELLDLGDLGESDIRVSLAPNEVFERSGVERFIFLNDLRFSPMIRGSRGYIRVASSKPVREPYLNFIVEVARPNGRLLREYTLLLDPPESSAYRPVAAPLADARAASARPTQAVPAAPREAPPATQGKRYTVARGDSLWGIAQRLSAGSGMSTAQMMNGIHALNAAAFANGDPSRLSVGQSLLLPDAARVEPVASVAPATAPDSLRLSEPDAPVAPNAPAPEELPQQLAEVQRRVDAELANSENERLQLRQDIADLQLKLESLQQLMAEKDAQLARLQGALQQQATAQPPVEQSAAQPQAEAAPAPPTAAPAVEPEDTGLFTWPNSLLFLGVPAILLVLLLLVARRRKPAPDDTPAEPVIAPAVEPRPRATVTPLVRPAAPAAVAAPVEAPVAPPARVDTPSPAPRPSSDSLDGANIYIAYGRFRDAETALRAAIVQEPRRIDLRLRLLEVLGELGESGAFASEAHALTEMGMEPARIDAIKARYPVIEVPSEAAPMLEEATIILNETPLVDEVPSVPLSGLDDEFTDEFQLNLADLPLDADWDSLSPFKPDAPKSRAGRGPESTPKAPEPAVDPSFKSNLHELPEVFELDHLDEPEAAEPLPLAQADEELVFDLGDDDLEHLAAHQENIMRLNLALAYIDQGDVGSACNILNEVIDQGDEEQKQEARELLARIA